MAGNGGSYAAGIELFSYYSFMKRDQLISPPIDLSSTSYAVLSFEHAYALMQNSNYGDSLIVKISTDCGNSWERLLELKDDGSGNFATHEWMSDPFVPALADDWCGNGYGSDCFEVDISPESLKRTTLGRLSVGAAVNIERALRLSDRLDGHLVSGHIDGTGTISSRSADRNWIVIGISVSPSLSRYMIEKGSVAVDGISLTINSVQRGEFSVSVIPHTAKMTTLQTKSTGDAVNIETDMVGKYVERFLTAGKPDSAGSGDSRSGIDMEFLSKTGFM